MPRTVTDTSLPPRVRAACRRLGLAAALVAGGGASAPATGASEVAMANPTGPRPRPGAAAAGARDVAIPGLPEAAGAWRRAGPARRIEPDAIFEYMDGAGELYLAYRFDHLDVVEYRSDAGGEILVELYSMRSSDDAFGLLSGDWGGEPVDLGGGSAPPQAGPKAGPWPRALYGSGLLRIWSGDLYARVFAAREGEAAREAVLALGRAIARGRAALPPPALAAAVAAASASGLSARTERLCFLRSHLVLNSAYFLSQRDLLGLGPAVEAVVTPFTRPEAAGGPKVRATVAAVRYPDARLAGEAAARFRKEYLREEAIAGASDVRRIEDGWSGTRRVGAGLALVFEAPDRAAAEALLAAAAGALERAEVRRE